MKAHRNIEQINYAVRTLYKKIIVLENGLMFHINQDGQELIDEIKKELAEIEDDIRLHNIHVKRLLGAA